MFKSRTGYRAAGAALALLLALEPPACNPETKDRPQMREQPVNSPKAPPADGHDRDKQRRVFFQITWLEKRTLRVGTERVGSRRAHPFEIGTNEQDGGSYRSKHYRASPGEKVDLLVTTVSGTSKGTIVCGINYVGSGGKTVVIDMTVSPGTICRAKGVVP